MTSQELSARVRAAIDGYEYPRDEGTVGRLWTPERVADELALLRRSIVHPSRRTLRGIEHSDQPVWLVAALEAVAVFFDENRGEFGLGKVEADGSILDCEVYGDFVGTFMAR